MARASPTCLRVEHGFGPSVIASSVPELWQTDVQKVASSGALRHTCLAALWWVLVKRVSAAQTLIAFCRPRDGAWMMKICVGIWDDVSTRGLDGELWWNIRDEDDVSLSPTYSKEYTHKWCCQWQAHLFALGNKHFPKTYSSAKALRHIQVHTVIGRSLKSLRTIFEWHITPTTDRHHRMYCRANSPSSDIAVCK